MAQLRFPQSRSHAELQYVRPPKAIHFPEQAERPEGYAQLVVRMFLFRLLSYALGGEHTACSNQFVYWDASDAKRCLAPDVFVRMNHPQPIKLGSWQTWVRGALDLAIEIVSPNEGDGVPWAEKLARYHQLGVQELVRFDPEAPEGQRLRAWARVEGDLVERAIRDDRTPCLLLDLAWSIRMIPSPNGVAEYLGLRLMDDEGRLLETQEEIEKRRASLEAQRAQTEAQRAQTEAQRAQTEAQRAQTEAQRAETAEARIRQLEEQLRKRGNQPE